MRANRAERVIFVFLDGVGLGSADPDENPLAARLLPSFARLAGGQPWTQGAEAVRQPGHVFLPIDATLGVPGLPQSGTGQATLFTGVNCARLAGRHWGPFPHSTSKPVIASENLFVRLRQRGRSGLFANAFPERFFRMVAPRDRWTVTTRCCVEAEVKLLDEHDLRAGEALPADLTGAAWPERLGISVPIISPQESGKRLARLARTADVTLFEYFLTDKAGHARDAEWAGRLLQDLDEFFLGLLADLDPASDLLVVSSDHGNLENVASRVHTMNPVPLVALGAGAERLGACRDLADVTPAIVAAMAGTAG